MDVANKSGKCRTFYFSFDLQTSHADAADTALMAQADAADTALMAALMAAIDAALMALANSKTRLARMMAASIITFFQTC